MMALRDSDLDALARSPRLLIATDFDGTLAPICSSPDLVSTPATVVDAISRLRATGRVVIGILSGRKLADLAAIAPQVDVLAGNHGLEISGAVNFLHPAALECRAAVAEAREALSTTMRPWRGAWVEDKELTVTVHVRSVDENRRYEAILAARGALARFGTTLGMRAGKCALEVHPRVRWNKGDAVQLIRERLYRGDCPCLCLGDDNTDENMFRVLPDEATVKVGGFGRTLARFRLENSSAVSEALSSLADRMAPAVVPTAAAAG